MNRTARQRSARLISLPRVLLLVLLALGVCGMHTFGHGGHAARGHDATAGGPSHGMLNTPAHNDIRDLPPIAQVGEPTAGGTNGLGLFSVCLAVLSAFGLAIGLMLLRVHSQRQRLVARTRLAVAQGGRGPPVSLLGLRVAAVSVLRI